MDDHRKGYDSVLVEHSVWVGFLMEIKETNEFQVVSTIEKPVTTPKALLEHKASKKQVEILGKILEAQYCVGDDYLLLVTEGSPFEEALYLYYFNNSLQLKDFLELSAMYAGGMIKNLAITSSNTVRFSFFEDEQWTLEILSNPKYKVWNNKYPVKRKLSIFHKSWLKLEKS